VYVQSYLFINKYIKQCVRKHVHTCVCICKYIYKYICLYSYMYIHICIYTCIYIYIHIYQYIYMYIQINLKHTATPRYINMCVAVLQCIAVLPCLPARCRVLQCVAARCSVLQRVAATCSDCSDSLLYTFAHTYQPKIRKQTPTYTPTSFAKTNTNIQLFTSMYKPPTYTGAILQTHDSKKTN